LDELQALTQSIGEYAISVIGRENLSGIQVTVDRRNMSAQLSVRLAENSDETQLGVIMALFDVERMYADEVVVSYSFVEEIDVSEETRESVRQYSVV
jgi:hypothetical protein